MKRAVFKNINNGFAICILLLGLLFLGGCKDEKIEPTPTAMPTPTQAVATQPVSPTPTYMVAPSATATPTAEAKKVICIDPGHQTHGNSEKEPNGPGSDIMKAKVTGGTTGVKTKLPEYKLTLTVSLMLKEELEKRGYEVIMTRTEHDVDISNMERATIANEANVDAFIRVHANSSSGDAKGVLTICQTPDNPFNSNIYPDCRLLSQCILDCFVAATDAKNRGIWETDTMSGINWATVPVTILEMGFMSDPEEDVLMSDPEYQAKMVKGVADGIDLYFLEIQNQATNN